PGLYVSLSSEVLPQIKEYERVWTTVVNAYVGPALSRYLTSLATRLRAQGYRNEILIMQSHGGVAPIRESARLAAGAVLSGPAGGIAAGRHVARLTGRGDLVTFDMGGTSTDIALLQGGEPTLTGEKTVGIARVALPALDIHTLGAGGGSIAWVDAGRILRVGPESAGADPGPACYGRGGTAPTVTDANLVRGLLDPGNFLGGRIALDVGAAGLQVTEVARVLEIRRVMVPSVAAVLSAWGMLATDLRYELVRSHVSDVRRLTATALRRLFASLEKEGRRRLGGFGGAIDVRRALDMRYGEQIFEITVP